MKSTEFIIGLLKTLQKIWGCKYKLHIVYAYDKTSNFHIIEIDTEQAAYKRNVYINWMFYVYKYFTELFPNEDILISEPDPCDNMSNVLYEYNKSNKTINSIKYKFLHCGREAKVITEMYENKFNDIVPNRIKYIEFLKQVETDNKMNVLNDILNRY